MCDGKELLVGYLYDELSDGERHILKAHLTECGACRTELEGLRATRTHLAVWSPPEPDLGFRVIRGGAAPAPALPRRLRMAPAFAFAAAAVVVLAVAAAIANVEIRYGNDGLLVRTGWAGQAEDAPLQAQREPAPGQVARAAVPASGSADFAELDRRLRGIEAALASQADTSGTQLAGSAITGMSDAEMLRQVRRIVSEAEARQETAVAVRLLQLVNDFDQKRRTDIALLQQGLDQYQGMTNAEIAQSRDLFNRWIRAAARQEK